MEIHPAVFIGTIVIPLFILAGVMSWVFLVRKRNGKKEESLKLKAQQAAKENELFETLVSYKDKHINLLRKKLKD